MATFIFWAAMIAAAFGLGQVIFGDLKVGIVIGVPGWLFLWWLWRGVQRDREQLEYERREREQLEQVERRRDRR